MASDTHYTLAAVPFRSQGEQQRSSQFQALQANLGQLAPIARLFMIPTLKVGTLDSLLEASDELVKLDPQLEGQCFKLAGILEEVTGSARQSVTMLRVNPQSNDVSSDYYLKDFSWNSAMYDPKESIAQLLQRFAHVAAGADERTRPALLEHQDLKNKIEAASRRKVGNLGVRPIAHVVRGWCHQQGRSEPVESEFLTTLFVAVPVAQQDEWLSKYATFHSFVVPRSSTVVANDSDFVLNSIICFKKAAEDVKIQCRKYKYLVRDIATGDELSVEQVAELERKIVFEKNKLTLLLAQQFTHCYMAWIHCKAVRLYVEALLRFGLPPRFVPVVLAADAKKDQEVRSALSQLYGDYANKFQRASDGMADTGALEHDHPFVCLKVANVQKSR